LCLHCRAPLELLENGKVVDLSGYKLEPWQCPVCYRKSKPQSTENEGWQCYCGTEVRPEADGMLVVVRSKRVVQPMAEPPATALSKGKRSPSEITGYAKKKRARDRAKRQQQK
jgi:hypothetical protein